MNAIATLIPTAFSSAAAGAIAPTLYLKGQLEKARTCPKTGLPTRYSWMRQARRSVRRREADRTLLLDLNGFKAINDTHGHAAGDAMIAVQGSRFRAWCERTASVGGKFGGDEFVAMLSLPEADLAFWLDELLVDLARPMNWGGTLVTAPASIGIATVVGHTLRTAMHAADQAMYACKKSRTSDRPQPWVAAEKADYVMPDEIEDAPIGRVRDGALDER